MVAGTLLKDVSIQGCKEMVCQKGSEVVWFFAGILMTVFFLLFILIVTFRNQVRVSLRSSETDPERIKLEEFFES